MRMLSCLLFLLFTAGSMKGQDWPNLAKYKEANLALAKKTQGEKRIVFLGNSITEGWMHNDPSFFQENGFINRGIGGQTTPQMLLRFRQDVIDIGADMVIILAGTNDIAGNTGPMTLEEILDNFKSMTELAQSAGIEVVLCSVLPAHDYAWRPGLSPDVKIPKLNAMLRAYADSKGEKVRYLDYFTPMADERNGLPEALASDGVHPTTEGYLRMKEILMNFLQK